MSRKKRKKKKKVHVNKYASGSKADKARAEMEGGKSKVPDGRPLHEQGGSNYGHDPYDNWRSRF